MVVCQIPYGVQTHRRISRPERDFHILSACFIAMAATRKVVDIGQKRETVVCGFGIRRTLCRLSAIIADRAGVLVAA